MGIADPLLVTGVKTTEPNGAAFQVEAVETRVVRPGTSVTVPVMFTPVSQGAKSGTLELTANDTDDDD